MKDIKLKVMEALQEEAYKGIVRIDSETMKELHVHPGDVVEIEGSRITVGIVDRAYPTDVGQSVIRMDGIIRRNAKTGIGEYVAIKKADVKEAKNIIIAPAQKGIMIKANPQIFKRALLGRAVLKGDIVVPGGFRARRRHFQDTPFSDDLFSSIFEESLSAGFGMGNLRFIVASTDPKNPVLITENTDLELNPKAMDITEEKIPEVTYEDIGGLTEEIKKIREMVEVPLKHPQVFEKLGIEPPKGVLLHGPPGTGKTLLAKAVANESEANFVLVNGPEIVNKFYGESEKRIREIFDQAEKNAPSIIFFDEFDAIASKREESYGELERRVVSQILTQMDGLKSRGKVVVIAATNRPNAIDPALRRPGRFDREIQIGVPNKEGRLNVLKIHTRNMPLEGDFYEDIASKELINNIKKEMINLDKEIIQKEKNLSSIKSDIETLQHKLEGLLSKQRSVKDENVIDRLLSLINQTKNKINDNKKQLEDLNKETTFLKLDINKLKEIKEDLEKTKNELKKIINIVKSIEHSEEVWGTEDPRISFINITTKKELAKKLQLIISDLIGLNIINKNFYSEVRQKGWLQKDIDKFAEITHGFVGADIAALCKEAAMNVLRRILPELKLGEKTQIPKEITEKLKVTKEDFDQALKLVRPSAMREVLIETPNVKWADIGGLDNIKQELKEAVEWPLKHPSAFKRIGIRPPRGLLMYGPPGTGKTLLAKAVANESEANFIQIKGPELLNKFVGESEKGLRKIFEKARQVSPAIIFFDEIDALALRRGSSQGSHVTENVVNTLLAEMDGLEELNDVIVIAATNRPDRIDPALLRPGRFDRLLLIIPPLKEERLEVFKIHTKNMPLTKDVDLKKLAEKTEGYVGADIESVCREAGLLALREDINTKEIKKKYFDQALKKVIPSVSPEAMEQYKNIEETYLRNAKAGLTKDIPSYMG